MNPQGYDESRMIENELSMMKFESDDVCEQIILLKLSLSRFGESILKYFHIIVIKEFTFPYFCVFCSSLCPSLKNTTICDFHTKCFHQTGTIFKTFNSLSFEILRDGIDCDLFSSNFNEQMVISFDSSESLIKTNVFSDSIIGIGFIMKEKEKEKKREEAEFSMEGEKKSIESEITYFREVLELSGG
jgi:hypothetical protein